MALPYGLPQRCLQAVAACWLISYVLSFVTGGCSLVLFTYLAVVALPAVAIYSFMNVDPGTKAVLVTGCDSGFGHALALHLHDLGFVVFAGCLMKDKGADSVKQLDDAGKNTGRLITVQMNVTSDAEVAAAVETVRANLPPSIKGLWAVVNNAGFSTFGEMEWVPINVYEMVASINLFGLIRVTKGFLPLIREAQGRVVNVASMLGRTGAYGRSPYCATKFGVEAVSDCLRMEMKKFNVDVAVIEPGNFIAGTSLYNADVVKAQSKKMWDGMTDEIRNAYGQEYFDQKTELMLSYTTAGVSDISPVVNAMTDAVIRVYPRCRYQPMALYELFKISVATHLPEYVYDAMFL
ncbi:D-beta-hydroxybutyrate dehydrogenase, mitochondrial-like [Daphnia pulex]|uniref:D-beta-hydroxybutyrate dehydrogenase, mitochondrial-like n=2 Tax=Daphnia TaxID=6668 RepID=UPI001EDCBB69|nr:D-beta-hydroxybutyrate dehydrogenase, mitochondrial-like [Daphnia pulex]XP_046655473.1 D-beta-hydroxybutyrate dehydrogenase, mitochondrial-like isoform X2 [Daphnia pulicaria]XP_046655474.1 D-beta-hydroxybutyrate dehydrogenase, mitochondrial-like isoform X2 [Daphnia pulicaria]